MNSSLLAQPVRIGQVLLRNRVVLAPMDRNYCNRDGTLTDRYIAHLAERAAGGAALVYPEAAFVRADGRSQPNQMALDTDEVVPDLRRLADAVHAEGSLLGVQLNHAGNTSKPAISGFVPVAPSAVRSTFTGGPVPETLDAEDILDLVESYANAAARSVEAGVDVVMIHAAHGYLIHQFMMPTINQRTDEYGDPARFLGLVMTSVRERIPHTPVVLRVSAMDGVEGGLDVDGTLAILRRVPVDAVDCIDVSAGSYEAPDLIIPAGEREAGWLAAAARRFREFGTVVSVAGRITSTDVAEELLRRGDADLVAIGRGLHADARWAALALASTPFGDPEQTPVAPRPCIAANACIDELGSGSIRCSVNPRAGREQDLPPLPASSSRVAELGETLVVGAGPAGLETAVQLARWGIPVRLVEREAHVGGQFALAAGLRGCPDYHGILDWYQSELARLSVPVALGTNFGPDDVPARNAHALVLAIGSIGAPLGIAGAELDHVVEIREWLRLSPRPTPDSVVIWGGDREAMAVGDDLASRGAAVTFIFGGTVLGRDVGRLAKPYIMGRLGANPRVDLVPRSTVTVIEPGRCGVRSLDGEESWVETPGPLLISQGASATPSPLGSAGAAVTLPGGLWVVGDAANRGGSLADVVHDATATVTQLLAAAAGKAPARPPMRAGAWEGSAGTPTSER